MEPQLQLVEEGHSVVETPFGTFDVDAKDLVCFPDGLPGFEQCRRFAVLASTAIAPLQCLHAADGQPASFLAIDPHRVLPRYRRQLTLHDTARLGAQRETPLVWLVLVTVEEHGHTYANLRAPIVINPERMIGFQVMPLNTLYPERHRLTAGD
ncbi:MAG: flagellar assembly protein FliW [Vicinamibacterales bacterium]